MGKSVLNDRKKLVLERKHFSELPGVLQKRGYKTIGPRIQDGAIVYDELRSEKDLPIGMTDVQDGGTYRLEKRDAPALFGYAVGPHSWKRFLHLPKLLLWRATKNGSGFELEKGPEQNSRMAFFGVRACELHAISIQDKIFMGGDYVDPFYTERRKNVLIVAVNCGQPAGTCFCTSMNTGPKATCGFDLALTEVVEKDRHWFLIEAGTEQGEEVVQELPLKEATEEEKSVAERVVARAAENMGRTLETEGLRDLLVDNYEHPHWDEVAGRCLTCANCTMVCPTCFCTTVEDVTDLTGEHAERWRMWDSCFTKDFSYVHGGSVRTSARARYRQWMTHKLATWVDQFGTFGCVGCGRCITWCPVGIDLTKEVAAMGKTGAAQK